jgi:methylphosphotriester-DNA--protein-cysteine methyltransferase
VSNHAAFPHRIYRRVEIGVPGLVEHAWVVRDAGGERELLLPDGRGLVQVVAGEPGTIVDALTGARRVDADGVRGPATRAEVRTQAGRAVRLGVQLHPLAMSVLRAGAHADRLVAHEAGLRALVQDAVVARARESLGAGDDEQAARLVVDALVAAARSASPDVHRDPAADPDRVTFTEAVALVDAQRGLVARADLARTLGVTVSDLHRWSVRYLGVPPDAYLAAVRFSGFVRQAVGPGPVAPGDVVAALRWYAQAGQSPREVERFTGLTPAELRRVEERVEALLPSGV